MERINKPRVFLSHSSKDKEFIRKLDQEFRKAKIETWLDEYELRDGKSWLKMIFEDGLPSCSAILVYLTENSVESKMVQKELDSGLIQNLSDNNIAFLPYVANKEIRDSLRIDLKTLHCREFSEDNFNDVFPGIVSEVWMSFLEQKNEIGRLKDKLRLQELEKEIDKQKKNLESSPFSKSQIKDFEYIYDELNLDLKFIIEFSEDNENYNYHASRKRYLQFSINFIELIYGLVSEGKELISHTSIHNYILENYDFNSFKIKDNIENFIVAYIRFDTNFKFKLRLFSLSKSYDTLSEEITPKIYRFIYWLGFNKLLKKESLKYLGELEEDI